MRLIGLIGNFSAKFEWKSVYLSLNDSAPDVGTAKDPKEAKAPRWKVEVSLAALNFVKE